MAESFHQFDIDDGSPEIAYFPFANLEPSSNVSAGWQLLYTGSGAATGPGQVGVGTSYHYTSHNGASLSVNWNGTGIDLVGSVSNALYNVTLDGVPSAYFADPSNGILASLNDLENTKHSLLLTTVITNTTSPDAFLTFDKASITYAPPAGVINTTDVSQVIPDSDIAFMGSWSYMADSTGSSMHVSSSAGDRAEATFLGSAITIYGLTSSYSGIFTVTLDNFTTNLSALSSYNNSHTLLFYATDLPQDIVHHITVINQENLTFALRVGGMNTTCFGNCTTGDTSSSGHKSIPAGTIAAVVLGVVLFFVIMGIFYYACCMRQKTRAASPRTFLEGSRKRFNTKSDADIERAASMNPPSGELESTSLSTSKGYGFGLGLRRGFPFTYRKSKTSSTSSKISRNGIGVHAGSLPLVPHPDRDEKVFSISTLADNLVLADPPESEKLAPGWCNPIITDAPFKYDPFYENTHGVVVPELRMERTDPVDDDYDDEADVRTLTSRQDETLAATLSLSPRISEAPVAFNGAILSKLGIDAQDYTKQSQENRPSEFLQVRDISPFRVDVSAILGTRRGNRDSRRTSGSAGSTWSNVRARLYRKAHRDDGRQSYLTDGQQTPSSLAPEPMPVVMHGPGSAKPPSETPLGSGTYSFLDLASSHTSLRRQSKTTTLSSVPAELGRGAKEASTWSENTFVRMVRVEHSRDDILAPKPDAPSTASGGSHPSDDSGVQTVRSAPITHTRESSPFSFPITIPEPSSTHTVPPPDHVPEPQVAPSPPDTPPDTPPADTDQYLQAPSVAPPELSFTSASSPTESVPFSVSDIHFRHSFSDYRGSFDSRRASASSVLPPHPPLPHVDGSQASTPTYAPPYIVQRVLGLPMSPLSPVSHAARTNTQVPSSSSTIIVQSASRSGTSPTPTSPPIRINSLLGPRPRPSTAGSVRGSAPLQLPMQGGRGNLRGPR